MTSRLDESLELAVRHRRAVDPEGIDRDAMRRRFLGIMMIRSHAEGAAGNEDHIRGRIIGRSFFRVCLGLQHRDSPACACCRAYRQ
jgi:hypothetical protein